MDQQPGTPPQVPPHLPLKPTRAQVRLQKWNQRNWEAIRDEVNKMVREGDYEGVAELGLALIEVFNGTARLTASSRRLENATYVLIAETAVLAVLTYILAVGHI